MSRWGLSALRKHLRASRRLRGSLSLSKAIRDAPPRRHEGVELRHDQILPTIPRRTTTGRGFTAEAAFEARKLYVELKANGWEETLRGRRKPDAPKKIGTTIGDFIDAVREKTAILPKTIESYALALRKIAADIAGLSGGSRDAWDVKLSRLTPEAIEAWRIGFIRRKAVNPLAEKSAKVSASSFILRARSVFSAETVAPTSPDYIPF